MTRSVSDDKYIRQFAPDGKHFQSVLGEVSIETALGWFNDLEQVKFTCLWPDGAVRVVNQRTQKVVVLRTGIARREHREMLGEPS